MRVIGIDPGSVVCGYGVIEMNGNAFDLVEYGVVKAKLLSENFPERLKHINDNVARIIERTSPDVSAFETIFFSKNVQSLVKLSHARSAAILAAVQSELEVCEYAPNEVKKSVTGRGKAGKEQVQYMIKKMLNIKETPEFFDSTDALAVAICHCLRSGNNVKKKSGSWKEFIKENPERVKK